VRVATGALLTSFRSSVPLDRVIPNVREQVDLNAFGSHGQHRSQPAP
jgi:hypothetical protein